MNRRRNPLAVHTLPNGAELACIQAERSFSLLRAVFPVGTIHEEPACSGILHLLEHLAFRDSAGNDLSENFERNGAVFDARVGLDHLIYELKAVDFVADQILPLFLQAIFHPALSETAIAAEKAVVALEIEDIKDTFVGRSSPHLIAGLLGRDRPHHSRGLRSSMEEIPSQALRDLHRTTHVGATVRFIYVGPISFTAIFDTLSKYFLEHPTTSTGGRALPDIRSSSTIVSNPISTLPMHPAEEEQVIAIFPCRALPSEERFATYATYWKLAQLVAERSFPMIVRQRLQINLCEIRSISFAECSLRMPGVRGSSLARILIQWLLGFNWQAADLYAVKNELSRRFTSSSFFSETWMTPLSFWPKDILQGDISSTWRKWVNDLSAENVHAIQTSLSTTAGSISVVTA